MTTEPSCEVWTCCPTPKRARDDGEEHAIGEDDGADLVGLAAGDPVGHVALFIVAHEPHMAAARRAEDVHDAEVGVGALRPQAVRRAVDDARVDLAHRLVVDAELLDDALAEVLRHHVGLLDEAVEDLAPLRLLQVDGHRPLVAVHRLEVVVDRPLGGEIDAGHAARVAFHRVFDLDDVGPHVGEHGRGPRPVLPDRHVQHGDAVEGGARSVGRGHCAS